MGQFEKLVLRILSGTNDKNVDFEDLCKIQINNLKIKITKINKKIMMLIY